MSHIHDPGDETPEGATDSSRDSFLSTTAAEPVDDATSSKSGSVAPPPSPTPEDLFAEPARTIIDIDPAAASSESAEASEPERLASFDDFNLPQTLRDAIREVGWDRPTPVQSATFLPITEGKDVLVQSQTGTGKTGAFCVPWLAARFEPGDAAETGVQLIALTPTRELAKQVCEELFRLARFGNVVPLPIYGGTAMQPQLAALRAGVHAVVGTPGRVLDHIRRRSLDLSRVRMVVLDEADEMLSMGFLEDIHAILEACPRERQTTLFSATVPTEIERIARRYMHSPISLRLSGDDVAAAAIDHAYYSVNSSVKTRDLLDVIAVEEPATALVFCNTREEVNLVSSVLQREGFAAEPLSSDLTQAARERVLGWMREGRLRFLVATDVASRGIDISHISHVINYSFPENAESYVHRTGRTGRAGRAGQAISLIAATELGNFYYLKLQYPTITFSEKHLPPSEDLQAQRSELKLDHVSRLFPELVSPEWTLLARNLMKDPRGERVIAFLLEQAMAQRTRRPSLLASEEGAGAVTDQEPGHGRWERNDRGRGPRDRGRGDDRRGGRSDGRGRDDRPRGDRPHDDRQASDRPREHRFSGAPAPEGVSAEGSGAGPSAQPRPEDGEFRRNRRDRGRDRGPDGDRHARGANDRPLDGAALQSPPPEVVAIDREVAADGPAEAGSVTGEGGEHRRRRRRRGRRDREHGAVAGDPTAQTSAAADGETLEAEGDDAIGEPPNDDSTDELAVATPAVAMGADANPTAQGQDGDPTRRRRRRRRRGRSGQGAGAPTTEANAARPAAHAESSARGEDDDDAGDDEEGESEGDAAAESGDPSQRGRRRRRRRGRRRGAEAPAVAAHQVVVPPRPAGQDEIVVDIDESELQLVRDQFGEIDELDDFTLKARRRGVLDALAEEVELEDLSASDRVEPATAPTAADGADDEADDAEGETEGDDAAESATDDENQRKRRRRRRKKKKTEAEPAPPPLMVPPHKDFWEVWATHFNYRDFEDPASAEPEPEPEPDMPAPRADFGGQHDRGAASEDTWVNVRLSLGRSHAKKAADIRDLLADRTGLTGKSVRNLTVGDRDTEFQIGRRGWARVARAFEGVVIDGVPAEVTLLTVDPTTDDAAPAPEPITAAPIAQDSIGTMGEDADVEPEEALPVINS